MNQQEINKEAERLIKIFWNAQYEVNESFLTANSETAKKCAVACVNEKIEVFQYLSYAECGNKNGIDYGQSDQIKIKTAIENY